MMYSYFNYRDLYFNNAVHGREFFRSKGVKRVRYYIEATSLSTVLVTFTKTTLFLKLRVLNMRDAPRTNHGKILDLDDANKD